MQKWEYYVELAANKMQPFVPFLNKVGDEGWELVSTQSINSDEDGKPNNLIAFFFKRPKQ
jgi:hypothetical protein